MQFVAYYRVSTQKQGMTGLGMEAQNVAVQRFVKGESGEIIASYTEVESGKNCDRVELAKAIGFARRAKARLVIAKLDRLARNVAFLSALMECGLDFVCCDNPHATRLTIHILAAIAEDESRRISERTKAAMAVAKTRGRIFASAIPGFWNGKEESRQRGLVKATLRSAVKRRERAKAAVADLLPELKQLKSSGGSLRQIAERMNERHHRTGGGGRWSAMGVKRALEVSHA